MRSKFRFLPPVVGSQRFCSFRQASNGFSHGLAALSSASYLVRAISAVYICCSTNSRLGTPRSTFVAVGRNSGSISFCVISVTCSADQHKQNPLQMRNHYFAVSFSDKGTVYLFLRLSPKTPSNLDNQTCSSNPSKFPSLVNQASSQVSSQPHLSTPTQRGTSNDQPTLR